jgi:uncharacterized protein (DUF2062 family)
MHAGDVRSHLLARQRVDCAGVLYCEPRGRLRAIAAEAGMSEGFFCRRLVRPLLDLLRQGVTPEKLALSIAMGVMLGIFPVLGSTTVLCALAALSLQLSLPAIQLVNYFVYPLQIALLIPFFRLGERLFHSPHLPLLVPQIYAMIHADMGNAVRSLWTTTWHAILVWSLVAPLCAAALYAVLAPALRRLARRKIARVAEAA